MADDLTSNIDPAQKPLVYTTTGTLELGPSFEVSTRGVLEVTGGGITPGSTINCGSF